MRFLWEMKDVGKFTARHPILTLCAIAVMALPRITRGQTKDTAETRSNVKDDRKVDASNAIATFPRTNSLLINGTLIAKFDLTPLGVAAFTGKEKTTKVPTPGYGAVYYVTAAGWKGVLVVVEPSKGDTTVRGGPLSDDNDPTNERVVTCSDNNGSFAVTTEKGLRIILFDTQNFTIQNVTLNAPDRTTLKINKLEMIEGKNGKVYVIVHSDSAPTITLDAKTGEIDSSPPETPLLRERADSTIPGPIH
jgi:hypothetical protein